MSKQAQKFYQVISSLWKTMKQPEQLDATGLSACNFLDALSGQRDYSDLPEPFRSGVEVIYREFETAPDNRKIAFRELEQLLKSDNSSSDETIANAVWKAFYPEALYLDDDPHNQIELLRNLRRVTIEQPAEQPLANVTQQIVFTSNVLLSPPITGTDSIFTGSGPKVHSDKAPNKGQIDDIIQGAAGVNNEQQEYWYDHPIPIGIPVENDEVVYGLSGLANTLKFEKARGTVGKQENMQVFLSVSVTQSGLHKWAKPWLKARLAEADSRNFDGLEVYAFSEEDAAEIIEVIAPWLPEQSQSAQIIADLKAVFGVDGEYGRHYSFLKALPALWSVLGDTNIKATFKIDLDQVFPQEELVAETGKSAFELLSTPLWGAKAKDSQGHELELGMIAGALVNERDIGQGLFTPDIPWPESLPVGEDMFFYKQRTMAVSTRAELMTRYGNGATDLDGETQAIERIHVTGGTNGIRMESLRRHRPFTPGFIGRAEDQGYILSVLTGRNEHPLLRYVHASGLIMRHDKEAFATAAIQKGKAGAFIGDLVRLFVFSAYTQCLPGGQDAIKAITDPFTGCFITPLPATTALIWLALHLLNTDKSETRKDLLKLAGQRLTDWVNNNKEKTNELNRALQKERRAWNNYYDIIDNLENGLHRGDDSARDTAEQVKKLFNRCRITASAYRDS